jgi:hypothetical protein
MADRRSEAFEEFDRALKTSLRDAFGERLILSGDKARWVGDVLADLAQIIRDLKL